MTQMERIVLLSTNASALGRTQAIAGSTGRRSPRLMATETLTLAALHKTMLELTVSAALEEMRWAQAGFCVCQPCVVARRRRQWNVAMGVFPSTLNDEDCYYGHWRWSDPKRP